MVGAGGGGREVVRVVGAEEAAEVAHARDACHRRAVRRLQAAGCRLQAAARGAACMLRACCVHGAGMLLAWCVYGACMVRVCCVYAAGMVRLWCVHACLRLAGQRP